MSRGKHQDGRWYARAARHKRQNPICLGCWAAFGAVPATVSDHVIPITAQGGSLLAGELQPACRCCHSTTKRELERRFKLGQATINDLRLDSEMAKQLARRQRGVLRYGLDGRILDPNDPSNEVRTYSEDMPSEPLEWVRIDGEDKPATPEPTHSLPKHLRATLERQRARAKAQ
jgi:hypothetical protein